MVWLKCSECSEKINNEPSPSQQAYLRMACILSSEEYKAQMEEVFGNFANCSVSQEDRKFYLLSPCEYRRSWDWNYKTGTGSWNYKLGLHNGVRAIMFTPTVTIPVWLKSDQHRAIFRQLRSEFSNINEKNIEDIEKQVEKTEHDNDVAFTLFLLEAEACYRPKIERLIGAFKRLDQVILDALHDRTFPNPSIQTSQSWVICQLLNWQII